MQGQAQAQRKYDRDNGEQVFKRDVSEFSLDGMSKEQYAAREARLEAIKAEVLASLGLK